MPKVDILFLDGEKKTSIDLPALFEVEAKKPLLHQAVVAYLANQRQANAHTKTRGEVRGGGKKPWKQKGTGRARVGSSRTPIWVGGGITFGPLNSRNFTKRFPDKMKRLALRMALSTKAKAGKILVVDSLALTAPKTKQVATAMAKLAPQATSLLVISAKPEAAFIQAARNIPTVSVIPANEINTYDILSFDTLVLTKEAVEVIEKQLTKE